MAVLPTPGLADEHRIVLGAALQDLNGAADLIVAADHGIELALGRALGKIDAVFLERLAILLRARIVDLGAAANLLDRLLQRRRAPRPRISKCGRVRRDRRRPRARRARSR